MLQLIPSITYIQSKTLKIKLSVFKSVQIFAHTNICQVLFDEIAKKQC